MSVCRMVTKSRLYLKHWGEHNKIPRERWALYLAGTPKSQLRAYEAELA